MTMSDQEHQRKSQTEGHRNDELSADVTLDSDKANKLKADLDELLSEIDGVLEENAEEFVKSYVQKGGE